MPDASTSPISDPTPPPSLEDRGTSPMPTPPPSLEDRGTSPPPPPPLEDRGTSPMPTRTRHAATSPIADPTPTPPPRQSVSTQVDPVTPVPTPGMQDLVPGLLEAALLHCKLQLTYWALQRSIPMQGDNGAEAYVIRYAKQTMPDMLQRALDAHPDAATFSDQDRRKAADLALGYFTDEMNPFLRYLAEVSMLASTNRTTYNINSADVITQFGEKGTIASHGKDPYSGQLQHGASIVASGAQEMLHHFQRVYGLLLSDERFPSSPSDAAHGVAGERRGRIHLYLDLVQNSKKWAILIW